MPLVVEDGTGLATADSYNSLVEVADELALTGEDAEWLALASDTVREQHARRATRALDDEWIHRGEKKTAEQSLEWPRVDARDDDGWLYDSESLPAKIKKAHAQLCAASARAEANGTELQPDQSEPGGVESESVTVGPISISTTWSGARGSEAFLRRVEGLLSELVESGERMVRG